jgi:hypothetical protein
MHCARTRDTPGLQQYLPTWANNNLPDTVNSSTVNKAKQTNDAWQPSASCFSTADKTRNFVLISLYRIIGLFEHPFHDTYFSHWHARVGTSSLRPVNVSPDPNEADDK